MYLLSLSIMLLLPRLCLEPHDCYPQSKSQSFAPPPLFLPTAGAVGVGPKTAMRLVVLSTSHPHYETAVYQDSPHILTSSPALALVADLIMAPTFSFVRRWENKRRSRHQVARPKQLLNAIK